jgi:hypothetical protein
MLLPFVFCLNLPIQGSNIEFAVAPDRKDMLLVLQSCTETFQKHTKSIKQTGSTIQSCNLTMKIFFRVFWITAENNSPLPPSLPPSATKRLRLTQILHTKSTRTKSCLPNRKKRQPMTPLPGTLHKRNKSPKS